MTSSQGESGLPSETSSYDHAPAQQSALHSPGPCRYPVSPRPAMMLSRVDPPHPLWPTKQTNYNFRDAQADILQRRQGAALGRKAFANVEHLDAVWLDVGNSCSRLMVDSRGYSRDRSSRGGNRPSAPAPRKIETARLEIVSSKRRRVQACCTRARRNFLTREGRRVHHGHGVAPPRGGHESSG